LRTDRIERERGSGTTWRDAVVVALYVHALGCQQEICNFQTSFQLIEHLASEGMSNFLSYKKGDRIMTSYVTTWFTPMYTYVTCV